MNEEQVRDIVNAAILAERAEVAANPPPVVVAFARTPALANSGVLDYSSSEGMKIFAAAIAALPTKFTGEAKDLHLFLKDFKERASMNGWGTITTVTVPEEAGPPIVPAHSYDLVSQYGIITLAQIRAQAEVYEIASGRDAQNSSLMYQCLYNSLTEEAKLKVLKDKAQYEIDVGDDMIIGNGPLFLKVIVRNCTVDTMSTVFHIRRNLNQLKEYMIAVNCNIEHFNLYVSQQVEELSARGAVSSDLKINLIEAYEIVPDKQFQKLVDKKRDEFEEGTDVSVPNFMHSFLTKFKDLVRDNRWQAPTAEEAQIVALSAQVEQLQKANGHLKKATKKNERGGSDRSKKRSDDDPKYAWKKVKPKQGESKTKVVNGKTYHWCDKHKAWTLHTNNECRLSADNGEGTTEGLTLNQALVDFDEDSESEDEEDE